MPGSPAALTSKHVLQAEMLPTATETYFWDTFGSVKRQKQNPHTHIGRLLVVIYLMDAPGQAEVSDLHHVVLGDQDISGSQISVNTLKTEDRELKSV